ncbi:MAG: glycosyltransferase family 92 protein [Chlamydiia bacterium]|nr:glycosyltransferase family 92 protein [Chlamydiia bacterium]
MQEWIDYHRALGVEHFWLYDEASTDEWQTVLAPYIDANIVEVIDWSQPRKDNWRWNYIQHAAYKDALHRSLHRSEWLALIDIDEFILPLRDATLTRCLKRFYQKASGVYANWRQFGTSGVTLKPGQSQLFNLTRCSERLHASNSTGKSIVRPKDVNIEALFSCHFCVLLPGKSYLDGDGKPVTRVGDDLKNWTPHTKNLRINHYFLRDERYFQEVKIPWKLTRGVTLAELMTYRKEYNLKSDRTIIRFINTYHPQLRAQLDR